jgi:hypothetical protein
LHVGQPRVHTSEIKLLLPSVTDTFSYQGRRKNGPSPKIEKSRSCCFGSREGRQQRQNGAATASRRSHAKDDATQNVESGEARKAGQNAKADARPGNKLLTIPALFPAHSASFGPHSRDRNPLNKAELKAVRDAAEKTAHAEMEVVQKLIDAIDEYLKDDTSMEPSTSLKQSR